MFQDLSISKTKNCSLFLTACASRLACTIPLSDMFIESEAFRVARDGKGQLAKPFTLTLLCSILTRWSISAGIASVRIVRVPTLWRFVKIKWGNMWKGLRLMSFTRKCWINAAVSVILHIQGFCGPSPPETVYFHLNRALTVSELILILSPKLTFVLTNWS